MIMSTAQFYTTAELLHSHITFTIHIDTNFVSKVSMQLLKHSSIKLDTIGF